MKRSALYAALLLAWAAHADQITQVLPQAQGQAVKPPVAAPAPAPAPVPKPPAPTPAPKPPAPAPAPSVKPPAPAPAPTPPKPTTPALAPAPTVQVPVSVKANPTAISGAQAQSGSQSAAIGHGGDASASAAGAGAGAGANAGQGAGAAAGQGAGAGAGASAGAGAGAGAGSGNTTYGGNAPGGGSTSRTLTVVLPDVPPAVAPSMVGGNVAQSADAACGLAQRIVALPIYGTQFGMFSNTQILLGNTEKTEPYLDESGLQVPYIRLGNEWFGHQVLYSTAVLSTSGATSLSVGGFGSSGGGSAGGGVSGGMQQLVTTIQLRLCRIGPVAAAAPAKPAVVISELPLLTKRIAR